MPTHPDYPWERDGPAPSREAAKPAAGSAAGRILRIFCWGFIAIVLAIVLARTMRGSHGAGDLAAVAPLHFLASGFSGFLREAPGALEATLSLLLVGIPVTILHELGHAVVARRRLGGEVRISVGTAGKIANLRLGQITMSINALGHPSRRAGHASFSAARASARDIVLIALAGPAASLLGCLVAAWALSHGPRTGLWHDLLWAATAAGAFAVLNILPFEFQERHGGPRLRSDGLIALKAARVARSLR